MIREYLKQEGIDGWLVHDFRGSNDLALPILRVSPDAHMTRNLFYWIPCEGEAVSLVHQVESHLLSELPGKKRVYQGYEDMVAALREILPEGGQVAMEVSELNRIPYVSRVSSGVVDLIRSLGVKVVSSAGMLQGILSKWDDKQLAAHRRAANILEGAFQGAFSMIRQGLDRGEEVSERRVQRSIGDYLGERGLVYEGMPFCGVNEHAANPHYEIEGEGAVIREGDLVLIDLWGRENIDCHPYADITAMAMVGGETSSLQKDAFNAVLKAQQGGIELIRERFKRGERVSGAEVDWFTRQVIAEAGFGDYILHRTGHNIGVELHGPGAHLDSFEMVDDRYLIAESCFSVEPGVYIPGEFGIRLEVDVFIHSNGEVEVTTPMQEEFYKI